MFVDSHCHLTEIEYLGRVIDKALKAGVELMLSNSVDLPSITANLSLQKDFPEVKALLGLHPGDLLHCTEEDARKAMDFIELNLDKAVGVGETGLDFVFAKTREQKERQLKAFKDHIELALDFDKALCVHSRNARQEAIDALKSSGAKKVLMHWFYGSSKQLREILDEGWFIGLGPSILGSSHLHSLVKEVPLSKLLLETDSPVNFNGKPSEPSWIPLIAKKVSELKEISLKEVEETTTQGAFNLFKL